MAAFGSDESKNNRQWRRYGLKQHKNSQLREAYHHEVIEMLASLGIDAPDMNESLERGREFAAQARSAATQ
jgi:1,2-phenylacetyl-CoA epoxidase catalytic subunit